MKSLFWLAALINLSFVFMLTSAGCFGVKEKSKTPVLSSDVDEVKDEVAGNFVEAYIEFLGPPGRWAGPPNLVLHVMTQDREYAKIDLVHASQNVEPSQMMKGDMRDLAASQGMDVKTARARLDLLGATILEARTEFKECLSPIRVRLVRGDGTVLQRVGCRGQTPWAKNASSVFNDFMTHKLTP